jgi:hypothetical protein
VQAEALGTSLAVRYCVGDDTDAVVHVGLNCELADTIQGEVSESGSHLVLIRNLLPSTAYCLQLESRSAFGGSQWSPDLWVSTGSDDHNHVVYLTTINVPDRCDMESAKP